MNKKNKEMKTNEASSKIVDLTMNGASKEELEAAINESKEMIDELRVTDTIEMNQKVRNKNE